MRQTLHLIRHGQIDSNVRGVLDTAVPGPPLNQTGLTEAERLVTRLDSVPLDALYTSTALRTQMTAQPLARTRGLEPQVRDGLKEIWAGELELRSDRAAQLEYHRVITAWLLGDLTVQMGGGTTGHEVLDRFDSVVQEITAAGPEHTAIVAHGAVILFWSTMRAPNLTGAIIEQHPPINTGVVTLVPAGPQGARLISPDSAAGVRPDWRALSWMGQDLPG